MLRRQEVWKPHYCGSIKLILIQGKYFLQKVFDVFQAFIKSVK